jgi:hypothetical protein
MTITNENVYTNHDSDGVTVEYAYDFRIDKFEDMHIYFDGVEEEEVSWSISGIGNPNGGAVIFNVAPADGLVITLQREIPYTQLVDLEPYTAFPANVIEQSLDILTMQTMQLQEQVNRALLGAPGSDTDYNLPFPEANKVLEWDPTGTFLINGPSEGDFQEWVDECEQAVVDAQAQVVLATEQAVISESWANASNTYAANSAVSATESEGWSELSEDWADSNYGVVVGSGYSAKSWSQQSQYWANEDEDTPVPGGGGEYSAKHWAAKANTGAVIDLTSSDPEMIEVQNIDNNERNLEIYTNVALGIAKIDATGKLPLDLISVSNLVLRGTFNGSDLCPKYGDNLIDGGEFEEACGVIWSCTNSSISDGIAHVGNATLFSSVSQTDTVSVKTNAVYEGIINIASVTGSCYAEIGDGSLEISATGETVFIMSSGAGDAGVVQIACGGGFFADINSFTIGLHSLVEGWNFEEACGVVWTCSGVGTTISGNQAILEDGGIITQESANISSVTIYKVEIDVDSIVDGSLLIQIGDNATGSVTVTGKTVLLMNSEASGGTVRIYKTGAAGTIVVNSIRVVPADTEDCVEPDYRNPSERFTTTIFASGEYYFISGVVESGVGGHINLIDRDDYIEKVTEVDDNDAILYLAEDAEQEGSPEGWYYEPGLAVVGTTAAEVAFDDTSTTVKGVTVQAFNQNLDTAVSGRLPLIGGSMTGPINMTNNEYYKGRKTNAAPVNLLTVNASNNVDIGSLNDIDAEATRVLHNGIVKLELDGTSSRFADTDVVLNNTYSIGLVDFSGGSVIESLRATINDDIDIGGIVNHPIAKAVNIWQGETEAIVIDNTDIRGVDRNIAISHDNFYSIRNYADSDDMNIVGLDDSNHALLGTINGAVNNYVRFYQGGELGAELTFSTFLVLGRNIRLDNTYSLKFNDAGVEGDICEIGLDSSDNFNIGSVGTQPTTSHVIIAQGDSTAIDINADDIRLIDRTVEVSNNKAFTVRNAADDTNIGLFSATLLDNIRIGGLYPGNDVNIIQGGVDAIEFDNTEALFYRTPTHDNQAQIDVSVSATIDFTTGGRHSVALIGDTVLSFTPTTNVGNFLVVIDTDDNTCTFQAGVLWAGGEIPDIDNGVWILSLYWNKTYWFASASQFAAV